jgi:hypothetical protein
MIEMMRKQEEQVEVEKGPMDQVGAKNRSETPSRKEGMGFMGKELPEEILKEMKEGVSREEVTKLLSEMEMWEENGEDVCDGEGEPSQGVEEANMMVF